MHASSARRRHFCCRQEMALREVSFRLRRRIEDEIRPMLESPQDKVVSAGSDHFARSREALLLCGRSSDFSVESPRPAR